MAIKSNNKNIKSIIFNNKNISKKIYNNTIVYKKYSDSDSNKFKKMEVK